MMHGQTNIKQCGPCYSDVSKLSTLQLPPRPFFR